MKQVFSSTRYELRDKYNQFTYAKTFTTLEEAKAHKKKGLIIVEVNYEKVFDGNGIFYSEEKTVRRIEE